MVPAFFDRLERCRGLKRADSYTGNQTGWNGRIDLDPGRYPIDLGCTSGCPSQTATHSGNALYRFYTFSIARAGGRSLLRSRDERQFLAVGFLKAVFAFGSNWAICSALFWRRVFIGPLSGRPERPLPRQALLGSQPPNYNQFNRLPAWSIGNHSHGDPDL